MKKNYTTSVFMVMVLLFFGFADSAIAQNLLENGNMEIWEADTIAGWDIRMDNEISVTQETSIVFEGTSSAKVTVNGDRAGTDFGQTQIIIEDGETYDFSCMTYHTDGNLFFAWVIGVPGNYTFSSSAGIHSDNETLGEWTNFTWQFTNENALYDTVNVFYRFYKIPNGSQIPEVVYIDAASVTKNVPGTDATLSDLTVAGGTIEGFDPGVFDYEVFLPEGITEVPEVGATPADDSASVDITPATSLSGEEADRTTTILITAEDGTTTQVYTVLFTVVTTGVQPAFGNALKVYPVPANNQLIISGLKQVPVDIFILDVTGRVVKQMTSTGKKSQLDISGLNPGHYFIKVEDKVAKFIKQ